MWTRGGQGHRRHGGRRHQRTWQYTLNGTNWFSMGSPSLAAALLLPADATTRLRFVPNANWSGVAQMSYKAWDQTSGVAGGTGDASISGGTTAFSTTTSTTSYSVNAVNDAPVLFYVGSIGMTGTDENTVSSPTLINDILVSAQITDVDVAPLQGLAVTAVSANGTFQYSTDA